jgi:hypothetical protein
LAVDLTTVLAAGKQDFPASNGSAMCRHHRAAQQQADMRADILEEVDEGDQCSAHLDQHGSQQGSALCRHQRGEQQRADILEEVDESDQAEAPGQALICCMAAFGSSGCCAVARGQETH